MPMNLYIDYISLYIFAVAKLNKVVQIARLLMWNINRHYRVNYEDLTSSSNLFNSVD